MRTQIMKTAKFFILVIGILFQTNNSIGQIAAPENLKFLFYRDSTILSWDAVIDVNLDGYQVLGSKTSDTLTPVVVSDMSSSQTTFNVSGIDTITYYWVKAKSVTTELSAFSNHVFGGIIYDGLVAWYPFQGNAKDGSGNGNHGTVNGAILSSDRFGNLNSAYEIAGSNYISHSTSGLDPLKGTFMAWIKPTSTSSVYGIWQTYNVSGTDWVDWYSLFNYYGSFYFRVGNGSNSSANDVSFNTSTYLPANTWTNLIATWEGNKMKIFANGHLISERNNITLQANMDPMGRIGYAYNNSLNGVIDDVAFYNRALTPFEIENIYSGQISQVNNALSIVNVYFGNLPVNEDTTYAFRIVNNSSSVVDYSVSTPSAPFTVSTGSFSVPANDTSTLGIIFAPPSLGEYCDSFYFEKDDHTVPVKKFVLTGLSSSVRSGVLTNNTTWTKANSPYFITNGGMAIDEGVKLTIEAGVKVVIDSACRFIVNGELEVNGSVSEPVLFVPDGNDVYRHIDVVNGKCVMQYVNISNASGGIGIEAENSQIVYSNGTIRDCATAISLTNCSGYFSSIIATGGSGNGLYATTNSYGEVKNCTFNHYNYGIYLQGSSSMNILGNTCSYNTSTGIILDNNYGKPVEDNTCDYNNNGISISGPGIVKNNSVNHNKLDGLYICGGTVLDNKASYNGQYGIYINCGAQLSGGSSEYNSIGLRNDNSTARSISVRSNTGSGILLYGTCTVQSCIISGNEENGIKIAYGNAGSQILSNLISGNLQNGISIDYYDGIVIKYNDIISNAVDGIVTPVLPVINQNNIYNNGRYNLITLQENTSNQLNAKNNYWGTGNIDLARETTFDYYDNLNRIKIDMIPLGTSPVTQSDSVTGFDAIALDGNQVKLSWNPISKAATYKLFYDNASGTIDFVTPLATLDSAAMQHTVSLAAGVYKFAIRATDTYGQNTPYSYCSHRSCSVGDHPINISPAFPLVDEGKPVVFNIVSPLTATYQWQYKNNESWGAIVNGGNFSGASTAQLNIAHVADSLENIAVRAILTSSCGSDTSFLVIIKIGKFLTREISLSDSVFDFNEITSASSGNYSTKEFFIKNKGAGYLQIDSIGNCLAPFHVSPATNIRINPGDSVKIEISADRSYLSGTYTCKPVFVIHQSLSNPVITPSWGRLLGEFRGKKIFTSNEVYYSADAAAKCRNENYNLLTISSPEENEFVTSKITTWNWIGFNDIAAEGVWVWTSGKPVVYTNWTYGSPDGGTGENYAMLNTNQQWYDYPYYYTNPFLFEAPYLNISLSCMLRPASGRFELSTDNIDFGSYSPSAFADATETLYIRNKGEGALRIDSISGVTQPFAHNLSLPFTIPAADSVRMDITLDRDYKQGVLKIEPEFYTNDSTDFALMQRDILNWYKLDGNMLDQKGMNNGTLNGVIADTNRIGQLNSCLRFDGTKAASITSKSAYSFDKKDFAFSFWFTLDNINRSHDGLFGRNDFEGVSLEYNHDGDKRLYLFGDANGLNYWELTYKPDKNDWVANQWYNCVVSRNSDSIFIYIDGQKIGQVFYNQPINNPSTPLFIGRSQLADRIHTGRLDEFMIFNRNLSSSEVLKFYTNAVGARKLSISANLQYIVTPQNFTGSFYKDSTLLSWNKAGSSELMTYNIYRNLKQDTLTSQLLTTVLNQDTLYTDNTIVPSTDYYYWIRAIDTAGYESAFSKPVFTKNLDFYSQNLIAWFPFNGNSKDMSGNGNNGNVQGATLAIDRFGNPNKAYRFNVGKYISTNSLLLGRSKFSVSLWVKPEGDGNHTNADRILSLGHYSKFEVIYEHNENRFYTILTRDSWESRETSDAVGSAPPEQWYNIAVTFDGSLPADNIKLYVDGKMVAASNLQGTILDYNNTGLIIGGYYGTPGTYGLNGCIDDIAIYNRALSEGEFEGSLINFGAIENNSSKTNVFTISNSDSVSKSYALHAPSDPFNIVNSIISVPADSSASFDVTLNPSALGYFADTIFIEDVSHKEQVRKLALSGTSITKACGIISGNTVWTKANSPYYINCNFGIDNGASLTIEKGVTVLIDSARQISINGSLVVNGTQSEPVILRPFGDIPFTRLFFSNGDGDINYCKISGASNAAIYSDGNVKLNLRHSIISNCNEAVFAVSAGLHGEISDNIIRDNRRAIRTQGWSRLNIAGNLITNNKGIDDWSVQLDDNNNYLIENNRITNGKNGLHVYNANTRGNYIAYNSSAGMYHYSVTSKNDTICNNGTYGVIGHYYSVFNGAVIVNNNGRGFSGSSLTLSNCTVNGNMGHGIEVSNSTIQNCIIQDNTGAGVQGDYNNISYSKISGNSYGIYGNYDKVQYSKIYDNTNAGIRFTTSRGWDVSFSEIYGNKIGIDIYGNCNITNNSLYGNTLFDVYAHAVGSDSIDARYNYWGTATTIAEVQLRTYDYYDDGSTVKVYTGSDILLSPSWNDNIAPTITASGFPGSKYIEIHCSENVKPFLASAVKLDNNLKVLSVTDATQNRYIIELDKDVPDIADSIHIDVYGLKDLIENVSAKVSAGFRPRSESARLVLNSDSINFGRYSPSSASVEKRNFYLGNIGEQTLHIDSISGLQPPFTINKSFPLNIPANDSLEIEVTLSRNSKESVYKNDLLFSSSDTFARYVANQAGLVAWWPLNNSAADKGPNKLNGTINGVKPVKGADGYEKSAMYFNGTSNYINYGAIVPTVLQIQNEITVSAWIYITAWRSDDLMAIVSSQRDACGGAGISIQVDGRQNPDGMTAPRGHLHFQIGNEKGWHQANTSTQIPLSQWVNIIVSRKANENARIFFNGILQPSTSTAWDGKVQYNCDGSQQFTVGRQYDYGRYFDGSIDEVRIYNRAVNYNEVQAIYQSALPYKLTVTAELKYLYPPENLAGMFFKDKTELVWNKLNANDLAGYKLYRADAFDTTDIQSIALIAKTDTFYSDNSIIPSRDYIYWLTAQDTAGFESTFSKPVSTVYSGVIGNGLVAWYPFNGSSNDESGNENNSISNSASLTTNRYGEPNTAYAFNSSTFINIPTTGFSFGAQPRTISLWVNPNTESAVFCYGTNNYGQAFGLSISSGKAYFYSYGYDYNSSIPLPFNTWTNIILTYNGSDVKLYGNGLYNSSYSVALNTQKTNLIIGGWEPSSPYGTFTGKIDDVAFYNRELSADEIKKVFEAKYSDISNYNFGAVNAGTSDTATIRITNPDSVFHSYKVYSLSGPYSVLKDSLQIPANGSNQLKVVFNPLTTGEYKEILFIEDDSNIQTLHKISLSGTSVTSVCGIIGDDTTWEKSSSPYYINCDFGIERGATLTIEKGVQVLIGSERQISIDGKLVTLGTETEPVIIKPFGNSKFEKLNFRGGQGDLNYTHISRASSAAIFTDGVVNLKLNHCIIENCYEAIYASNGGLQGDISFNTIQNNQRAIRVINYSKLHISHNYILNNKGIQDWSVQIDNNSGYVIENNIITQGKNGLWISNAGSRFNTFQSNSDNGVYYGSILAEGDTARYNGLDGIVTPSSSTLNGCVVSHNTNSGISGAYSMTISNCSIDNNGKNGIETSYSDISGSRIENNGETGITGYANTINYCSVKANKNGVICSSTHLNNNKIENNALFGVQISGVNFNYSISNNDIFANNIGVDITSVTKMNYNNFGNNTSFDVYAHTQGTDSIDARFNHWGNAVTKGQIQERTYDYYDDGSTVKIFTGTDFSLTEIPLQPVTGVLSTASMGGNIRLLWNNHPKAYQYYLYTDNGSGIVDTAKIWKVVDSLTNSVTQLLPDGFYKFGVKPVAYNNNTGYTAYSNTVFADNTPPMALSVFGLPVDTVLTVTFSEEIDPSSILTGAWALDNGLSIKSLLNTDNNLVTVSTNEQLPNINTAITLQVNGVKDVPGNIAGIESLFFYTDDGNSNPLVLLDNLSGEVKENITIGFGISDSENDPVTLHPQYSLDYGKTWKNATISGDTLNIVAAGYNNSIVWNSYSDLPGLQSNYVLFRLVPRDGDAHNNGTPGITNYLALDNNLEPVVSIPFITGEVHNMVTIGYTVNDPEGDTLSIIPEYYDAVSKFWKPATTIGITSGIVSGTHSINWNTDADLPGGAQPLLFRIVPFDYEVGISDTIELLLDNIGISSVQVTNAIPEELGGNVIFDYLIQDDEHDPITLEILYSTDGWVTSKTPVITGNVTNIGFADYTGTFVWNSIVDFPGKDIPKVEFKIIPHDANAGIGAAKTFRLDNNQVPKVVLNSITGLRNGNISIGYNLTDLEGDNQRIRLLYNHDGIWDTCSVTGVTENIKPSNYSGSLVWKSSSDMPEADDIYKLCLLPFDNDLGISDTIEIWINNLPRIVPGSNQEICRGDIVSLDAGYYTPTWTNYTDYLWNDNSTNRYLNASETGEYYVKAHDYRGKTYYSDTVNIIVHELPTPSFGADTYLCYGNNYTLDAGNYSGYNWNMAGQTGRYLTVDTTGNYYVEVTDLYGCQNADTAYIFTQVPFAGENICFVTVDAKLQKNALVWQKTPGVGTWQFNIYREKGSNIYELLGNVPFDSASFYIDKTSFPDQLQYRYKMSVTDSCGAEYNISKVKSHSSLYLTVNKGSGGYDLKWTPYEGSEVDFYEIYRGSSGDSLEYVSGTSGTLSSWSDNTTPSCVVYYQVRAVLKNLCTALKYDNVSSNIANNGIQPAIPVIIGATEMCAGESATLDAGNFSSYLWSNGKTTQTISVTSPGSYAVSVTNDGGCRGESKPLVLTVNAKPQFTLGGDTTACGSQKLTFTGPDNMSSYLWGTGSVSQSITVDKSGLYALTVTDPKGCSNTDEVLVTYQSLPSPKLDPVYGKCPESSVMLDPGEFVSYKWNDGSTKRILSASTTGTYSLEVADNFGCRNTVETSVEDFATPSIKLGADRAICQGSSTVIDPGTLADYNWSDGNITQTLTVSKAGNYYLTGTDMKGCTRKSDTIAVVVNELPVFSLGKDTTICGLNPITLSGPAGYKSYLWGTGSDLKDITISELGTYKLTVTDFNNCSASDEKLVIYNAMPQIALNTVEYICDGEPSILDPGEFLSYEWSNGSANRIQKISAVGNLSVTVTDFNGCTATKQVAIDTKSVAKVSLGDDLNICSNDSIEIIPDAAYIAYQWNTGSKNESLWVNRSGKYILSATDIFKCTSSDTIQVNVNELPSLPGIGKDTTLCYGNIVRLDAGSGFSSYNWSTGEVSQKIDADTTGTYFVTVKNSKECSAYAERRVNMIVPDPLQELCMVTIDNETGKNLVIWSRANDRGTASYNIYKETNQAGVYQLLTNQLYSDLSIYLDQNSVPETRSERYRIAVVDSCSNESELSDIHKTMHLTINVGIEGKFNLIWENYIGTEFLSYLVYRGESKDNLEVIDTVPSNITTYTDDPPPGGTYYYQVAMVLPQACSPAKILKKAGAGPYSEAVSNMEKRLRGGTSVNYANTEGIKIYPTLVKDELSVNVSGNVLYNDVCLDLISSNGQTAYSEKLAQLSGNQKFNLTTLRPGIYLVMISGNNLHYRTKIVVH